MILDAFLFGLFLAVAVGPIALLIVSYSIRLGLAAGMRSAFGAATADLGFATIAIAAGSAVAPLLEMYRGYLDIISAVVLGGFGLFMLLSAFKISPNSNSAKASNEAVGQPFVTTFLLAIANPLTVVAFAGFVTQLKQPLVFGIAAQVVVALFIASLFVQLVFAFGGAAAGRVLSNPSWVRGLNIIGAFGIIGYGLVTLIR